jgi:hypothetical protein
MCSKDLVLTFYKVYRYNIIQTKTYSTALEPRLAHFNVMSLSLLIPLIKMNGNMA